MRTLVLGLVVAMVLTLTAFPVPGNAQQGTVAPSVSVADLEKAGDDSRARKDYPQAIAYFNDALRQDAGNAKLYNKLGLAQLSNDDYAAAKVSFTKATRCDKNYPEAWNDLGVVSYIDKNYSGAVKYFAKAIELDPLRANFHVNLGITWFAQNHMDLAMHEYTRALQLDPEALLRSSNSGMSALLADRDQLAAHQFMLARIYGRLGDVDNCLVCLEKAKENGYRELNNVYKDDDFRRVRTDSRLASIVPPPAPR